MKFKSLNFSHDSAVKLKQNPTYDFINLYKSAGETSSATLNEELKSNDNNGDAKYKIKSESLKRERSPNKRKKDKREPVDISLINIDCPDTSSAGAGTPLNESKVTSTPVGNRINQGKSGKVKSIMKNSFAIIDDAMDDSKIDTPNFKSKKRNKSVSFMLEDNADDVVKKKTKSNESTHETKSDSISPTLKSKKHSKKTKKIEQAGKENEVNTNQSVNNSVQEYKIKKLRLKPNKPKIVDTTQVETTGDSNHTDDASEGKKKRKKIKKVKIPDGKMESKDSITEINSQDIADKTKKPKKKKHQVKGETEADSEEPASKSRKKEAKPDVIADLENLSIGDNAHTITNMLDEMTVVDKDKRKKLKQKFNKNKKPKGPEKTEESEKTEDGPEKVKWRRRKWNKETKADANEASLDTMVIVENLPLSLLFTYKKILTEHFVKYGLIKSVGIAEVYSTEVSKPVFTTTINFYSDGAATQALQDNTKFEGNHIRVKQPLPPTQTTMVLRSYATLTTQNIITAFNEAGQIRNIRNLVKGKHTMATFFIEFDGPDSVERAMKLATNAKIGGKKIYVSKFEIRTKKTKQEKTTDNEGSDADQSEGSQD